MKWHPLYIMIYASLSLAGCSRLPPPGAAVPAAPMSLAKEDLDQLQGAWRIESSVWDGMPQPAMTRGVTILFQGDKFIVVDKDGNRQEETIQLMPDQNPKAIDCRSGDGGRVAPGIYRLDGNTFRWCSAGAGNKVRPTGFASTPGSKKSLMVLRRQKN